MPTRKNTYAEKSRVSSPAGTLDIISLFFYFRVKDNHVYNQDVRPG